MDLKKMSKHTGKACALTASALLAAGCMSVAIPTQAFAIDETRTYTWANGQQQPAIPQTITGADGREYRLTNQGSPQQLNAPQTTTQQFSRTEVGRINADQLGAVGSIMPGSVYVDEAGYTGNIPRTGIDTTPVYRTDNDRITATQDGYGTNQEGARAALPQTINRSGRTLTLGDVQFEEARKDSAGNVTLWKAVGTYSVDVPRQVLDHYDVVAHYAGALSRTTNGGDWQIQAVYSADDVVPEEQQENPEDQAENTEEDNMNTEENINMMPPVDMDGNTIDDIDYDNANRNVVDTSAEDEDESGLPIVPIAVGAGVVVVAGIVAGILVARRKKNKSAAVAADGIEDAAVIGAVAAGPVMPVIIEDPQCQLIELIPTEIEDEDGNITIDYKQTPKADLEIEPSIAADIPTIIYFPSMEDEDGVKHDFEPTEGAQYWIAIDEETVKQVPSKEIIVASDDDKEIYRGVLIDVDGDLTDQMMLDTERMVAAVNADEDDVDVKDISEELEGYDAASEELIAAAAVANAEADEEDPFGDEDLDFEDDEEFGDDFVSSLDSLVDDDDEDEGIEDIEFADDELSDIFDGSEPDEADEEDVESDADDEDADPFAAYGIEEEVEEEDNFDSDFEKEMDDYEAFNFDLDEPDVDEFEYPEDFQENSFKLDEEEMEDEGVEADTDDDDDDDDEGSVLGDDLEDIDFEDEDIEVIEADDVELVEDDDEVEEPEVELEDDEEIEVEEESDSDDKDDIKDFKDLLNSI